MIPIFIGGTGSCGTTILKRILASHPSITSVPLELRIIVDPDGALDLIKAFTTFWSPYRIDKAFYRFKRLLQLSDSGSFSAKGFAELLRIVGICPRPYSSLAMGRWFGREYYYKRINKFEKELQVSTTRGVWIGSDSWRRRRMYHAAPLSEEEAFKILSDFFNDLYCKRAEIEKKADCSHWVEDTPENFLRFKELRDLFPNARFIHIFRDPRDVVASFRGFRWSGYNIEIIAKRISSMLNEWLKNKKVLPHDMYIEIRLESLGENTEKEFVRLYDFIGLPISGNINMLMPSKMHIGRWRKHLNSHELKIVTSILQPFLETYGYE